MGDSVTLAPTAQAIKNEEARISGLPSDGILIEVIKLPEFILKQWPQ